MINSALIHINFLTRECTVVESSHPLDIHANSIMFSQSISGLLELDVCLSGYFKLEEP